MIWNDQVLFIHAPKTAGMSLSALLLEALPGQIFATRPGDDEEQHGDVFLLPGKRHESMSEASSRIEPFGRTLESFERIFVVMREPYTLEISRYNYLRAGHEVDRGVDQDIAMQGDFKRYLREAPFFGFSPPRLDIYYHRFGYVPQNAVFLSFEHLDEDVNDHVGPYLKPGAHKLVPDNITGMSRYEDYYDEEAEALCYARHRWFFDKGFYRRRRSHQTG